MNDGLKIQRCNFLPEGEMAIVKDTNTLIHNIIDSELKEKDKEIERLNKDLDTAIEICNNRQKEIVKLNNIINELEKYLEQQWLKCKNAYDFEVYSMAKEDKVILDKLKELNGRDK